MLYPLSFALGRSGSQLKAAKNLAKDHSYLGHGERRTEAAAIAAAEREPGRGTECRAEHPARVEPVGIGVLLRAGVYQPDAWSDHDAGGQAVAPQSDGRGRDPADTKNTGRIRSVSFAIASRYSSPAGSPAALASAARTALPSWPGCLISRSSAHDSA